VLLADVAGAGRRAVAELLRSLPGVVLVAEVGSADTLACDMRHSAPDVLVIDDRLLTAHGSGPRDAGVAVIVVGVDDDPSFALRARRIGAAAWIPKERAAELLPDLLGRAHAEPGSAGSR
jgi:DNA-binding NarL/FixJ family response regulator